MDYANLKTGRTARDTIWYVSKFGSVVFHALWCRQKNQKRITKSSEQYENAANALKSLAEQIGTHGVPDYADSEH